MPQQYKVPQNIDLEDKIVGPFTMKQFGYLMGGGILIYGIYQVFAPYENGIIYTIVLSLPVALLAIALTFIKINDRPFEFFLINFFQYSFSPKRRIWQRGYVTPTVVIKTPVRQKASSATAAQKHATLDQIATSLDLSAGNTGAGAPAVGPKPATSTPESPGVQGYVPPAVAIGKAQPPAPSLTQAPTNQPPPRNPGVLNKVMDIVK